MARSFAALLLGGLLVLGAVRDTQAAQFLIDTIGDSITVWHKARLGIGTNVSDKNYLVNRGHSVELHKKTYHSDRRNERVLVRCQPDRTLD